MPVAMAAEDELVRSLIFSRFFPGNIHTDSVLWAFGKTLDDGAAHESGVAVSLAPTVAEIHRVGCSIAANQNADRGEPEPGPKRKYYCGYRRAKVSGLPLVGDTYEVTLTIDGEGGEPSHVDVALHYKVQGTNPRANARTIAGLALAAAFGPPDPYICAKDQQDDKHPLVREGITCLTAGFVDRWPSLYLGEVSKDDGRWEVTQRDGPPRA